MPFEPSPEIVAYADEAMKRYPQKRSAIMMILHALQREVGCIPLDAQEWVAELLDLAAINVREVVSFYPFYREHPIGKRHIRVCRTLSCALNGGYSICDRLKANFETELDAVSPDGRVTIEFAECLASCGTAPVLMIDDDLYENVTPEKVDELSAWIKDKTPAAPTASVPPESPSATANPED